MPKGKIIVERKIGDPVADLRSHTCTLTKSAQALMQETEAHFNRCDIRAAVKSTSQALSLYPYSLPVLQQAIKIKIMTGQLQEGVRLFTKIARECRDHRRVAAWSSDASRRRCLITELSI